MVVAAPFEADVNGIPWMHTLIPEGERGEARVSHFDVSEDRAFFASLRAGITEPWFMQVSPGRYARLHVGNVLMMSDTQMERRTNLNLICEANGDVLIAGLGLGMVPAALLLEPRREGVIRSVTVVEKSADVIALVEPHIRHPKLTVIEGDIFEWRPEKGRKFDTIYFDIWPSISTDNLPQMARLHRRFARSLNRENDRASMASWLHAHLRRLWRRNY